MSLQTHHQAKWSPAPSFTPTPVKIVQRKCACGGSSGLSTECTACQKGNLVGGKTLLIQQKLKLGQPNDKYEQEADRMADQVVGVTQSKVQRQVGAEDKEEVTQRKPIARQITPLVQRQLVDEGDGEQVQLKSHSSSEIIQREEPKGKTKSNDDKLKEGLKKTGEAFLKTEPGKAIVKKGKEVVTSLPGAVITGTAAVGAVSALIATNKALPIQAPAIPLDALHPGLSMKITVEGPLRSPSKAMISFSGTFGLPKRGGRKKPAKTASEKLREENIRRQRELYEFRESLKSPEEKARDNQMLMDSLMRLNPVPGLKPKKEVPAIEKEKKEDTPVQRKEINNSTGISSGMPMVGEVTQSNGKSLDPGTRSFMETQFGYDFNQVKIHTDSKAAACAESINARAFTLGQDVVFGAGQYAPEANKGRKLLAHELTHVIQQTRDPQYIWQNAVQPSSQSSLDGNPELKRGVLASA